MIADVPVGKIVTPATLDEAADAMRDAARRGASVAFMGGGTALGYGNAPEHVHELLKTERLNRIVEYTPADLVVTVEAGVTLGALQRTLAAENQRLALDPPQADVATLGGLLATNAYGPLRARYGTLRDLIVGIEVIRADGMRARGGGKVVKNVAGFDLPKLMVGSLGTLAMIATATFRLHPAPERRQWFAVKTPSLDDVRVLVRAMLERRLEPSAVVTERDGDAYLSFVLFEGFGAGVDSQGASLRELGGSPSDADIGARDSAARTFGNVRLKLATPRAFLPLLERNALAPLRAVFGDSRCVLYPTLGVAFIGGLPGDPDAFVTTCERVRATLESGGGHLVVLECADPPIRQRLDPFGTPPDAFGIMRRLKERFDPERRLGRGRFVGGL